MGRGGKVYTPTKTRDYETSVAWHAKIAMGRRPILTGPVELTISVSFSSKERGWHTKTPDASNICKSLEDAMIGIVYKDDSQVSKVLISKIKGLCDEVVLEVNPLS